MSTVTWCLLVFHAACSREKSSAEGAASAAPRSAANVASLAFNASASPRDCSRSRCAAVSGSPAHSRRFSVADVRSVLSCTCHMRVAVCGVPLDTPSPQKIQNAMSLARHHIETCLWSSARIQAFTKTKRERLAHRHQSRGNQGMRVCWSCLRLQALAGKVRM